MAELTLEKTAVARAANDAGKAVDMPLHKRAVALHSHILDLISPVPDVDHRASSCSRLTCHAISMLDQSDMTDNDPWLEALRDVEAMIRGALGCRDGTAEQQTALAAALAILWPLQMLLDGGNGGKPPNTALTAEANEDGAPLKVSQERRALGLRACWQADAITELLAQQFDEDKLTAGRRDLLKELANRAGQLICVALSIFEDSDTIEGLTLRLEGGAA